MGVPPFMDGNCLRENPSHKNQWMIIPIDATCSIQSDTGELRSNAIVVKSLVTFSGCSSQKKTRKIFTGPMKNGEMPMISGEEKFPYTNPFNVWFMVSSWFP